MLPFTQEPTELLKTSTALPGLKLGPSKEEHGRTIKTSESSESSEQQRFVSHLQMKTVHGFVSQ